jgi:hypothetical protein
MGCASEGPVVITASDPPLSGETVILALGNLKTLPLKRRDHLLHSTPDALLRASADGRVFGSFLSGSVPSGVQVLTIEGGSATMSGNGDTSGHVTPGDDGRFVFTGRGVYTADGKPSGKVGRDGLYCLPAVRGGYYLGMRINGGGAANKHKAHLFIPGGSSPLAAVEGIDWPRDMNEWDREKFAWDRRIWLVPEAKVLITIPGAGDMVVLHKLDADAALEKSGIDYLFVTSRPPASARRGAAFSYRLAVKSKKGGVKYELSSGPKGMTVTRDGEVKWAVPAGLADKTASVIVAVSDSAGQEVFHSFTLRVE